MADTIVTDKEEIVTPVKDTKPEDKIETTTPVTTTSTTTPADTTTTTTPVKEEKEEEFDVEEFKRTTVEETQKAVLEKMMAGLGMTKEEKIAAKDELTPPWEKRGESKPKSWKEHAEYAADLAEWKRKKEDERIAKVQEDQDKEAKEVNKKWNDYWDSELKGLEESGLIPAVGEGANDPGQQLRVKLFAKMKQVGEERRSKGLAPITSIELIYHKYKDELNEEPRGADAPISFGKKGVTTENKDDYSYQEIHGKSFSQLKSK